MSGGVDSSVVVALLKKRGYEVHGFFMRFWKDNLIEGIDQALADAQEVAKILEIPLHVIDAREIFQQKVVDYFLQEYKNGRTPNPCIFCNENIKFKILFEEMIKIKADMMATGHYAQIKRGFFNRKLKAHYNLLEAKDKNKDQSYFLYRLKQKQLARIIFPLGKYKKTKVRKIAKRMGLPVFQKAESQDVCFLANSSVETFLQKNLKMQRGAIINQQNKVIGTHQGLPLYTLGQRKGINIGGTGPYYVKAKDYLKNRLVVTNNKKELLLQSGTIILEAINWIVILTDLPKKLLVRTRYRNPLVHATIIKRRDGLYELKLMEVQKIVAPGQSVVFYNRSKQVIGGGIIKDIIQY